MPSQLCFIAIIPPNPLKEEIQQLKHEVKEKFHSSHSLNAPPHITLLSPFRLDKEHKGKLHSLLEVFAQGFNPFEIHFNDFSTFPPRVVFVDVKKTPGLMEIQQKLEDLARSNPEMFRYNYHDRPYHPHLTLAFKDLTKKNFHKAWDEFKDREFEASFTAHQLHLLQHNGERWEVKSSFPMGLG